MNIERKKHTVRGFQWASPMFGCLNGRWWGFRCWRMRVFEGESVSVWECFSVRVSDLGGFRCLTEESIWGWDFWVTDLGVRVSDFESFRVSDFESEEWVWKWLWEGRASLKVWEWQARWWYNWLEIQYL